MNLNTQQTDLATPIYEAMAVNHLKAWFSLQVISAFNGHINNLTIQRWVKDHTAVMNDLTFKSETALAKNGDGVALIYTLESKGLDFVKLSDVGLSMVSLLESFGESLLVEKHVDAGLIMGMNVKVEPQSIKVTVPLLTPLKSLLN